MKHTLFLCIAYTTFTLHAMEPLVKKQKEFDRSGYPPTFSEELLAHFEKSDTLSYETVQRLLNSGAKPNQLVNEISLVTHAARKGRLDICKALISAGAGKDECLNGRTDTINDYMTAYSAATSCGHKELCYYFTETWLPSLLKTHHWEALYYARNNKNEAFFEEIVAIQPALDIRGDIRDLPRQLLRDNNMSWCQTFFEKTFLIPRYNRYEFKATIYGVNKVQTIQTVILSLRRRGLTYYIIYHILRSQPDFHKVLTYLLLRHLERSNNSHINDILLRFLHGELYHLTIDTWVKATLTFEKEGDTLEDRFGEHIWNSIGNWIARKKLNIGPTHETIW